MRMLKTGLTEWDRDRATPGLTLFATIRGDATRLIDMAGEVVHQWRLHSPSSGQVQMLPGGHLLSTEISDDGRDIRGGGKGGIIREYNWSGEQVWEHRDPGQHHDARRLPNGNTLYLGWEEMPEQAARRVGGGVPDTEDEGGIIHSDYLREVTPTGETAWEWHACDKMDLESQPLVPLSPRNEYAHANTCFPMDDGVLISFRRLNAIFIVDRADGRVRWHKQDMSWGGQHDCQFLENGNILLFANGYNTVDLSYSRVIEFDPEIDETVWEYKGQPILTFFSPHISGAQRLESGNTLICEGGFGRLFEVTTDGTIVWEYVSPFEVESERGLINWIFRAYRYAEGSTEIERRLKAI